MAAPIQKRVFVEGDVQGVGFRASTRREAARYPRVRGYVRNLADGRVEAVFCGEPLEVDALVSWCRQGPPSARVTHFDVVEELVDNSLTSFEVRK